MSTGTIDHFFKQRALAAIDALQVRITHLEQRSEDERRQRQALEDRLDRYQGDALRLGKDSFETLACHITGNRAFFENMLREHDVMLRELMKVHFPKHDAYENAITDHIGDAAFNASPRLDRSRPPNKT